MTLSPKWHLHTTNLTIINNKFKWLLELKGKQENPHIREAAVIEPAEECDFFKVNIRPCCKAQRQHTFRELRSGTKKDDKIDYSRLVFLVNGFP